MSAQNNLHKVGFLYGTDPNTEKIAQKFVGHFINHEDFCKACEELETKVKCDHCREELKGYGSSIYYYEKLGEMAPDFIEEPLEFFPQGLPKVDYLVVVGIHQDLVSGLPAYAEQEGIKTVIIPLEDPKWVPPGLQVQVLEEFEKRGIQAAFPKPYCSLSQEENEYNKSGFNITHERSNINEFIEYFKIGAPVVSFKLSKDGKAIEDAKVMISAPCGSTFYIVQKLKGTYIEKGPTSLNERISKAHHSFPCSASMDQDSILKDSPLHVGGYLIRNEIRKKLDLPIKESYKLTYVIK